MGGRGSGRPAGLGLGTDKCNEFHSIDLAWLRRKKLLAPGLRTSMTWSRAGRQTGAINLEIGANGIRLTYRQRRHGGEWQDVNELVPLIATATRFGGQRQWFCCLSCNKRCRIIYGGAYFRCRRCHRLKYATQYEAPYARAATRALKIRERLGGKGGIDQPFPHKPKSMHWKTYDRLKDEDREQRHGWADGIMKRWNMFETTE